MKQIAVFFSLLAFACTDNAINKEPYAQTWETNLELRYEYKKHLVIETGFKGVFANYLDVLSVADSKANHHFFCLEWLISIGYQFEI